MTDVILGMGQVGETIYDLLEERKFDCVGIDSDESKCRNYKDQISNPKYLHVCIPGSIENFKEIIIDWASKIDIKGIIIHSTVRPGFTKNIQQKIEIPVMYSPVRGVHRRFLKDIQKYSKFVSCESEVDSEIRADFEARFKKVTWFSDTKTAELAKILVDTTYYGWLINYAQITSLICKKEGIDFDEMWKFAEEIHENLGNRPKMYPGIIGGHCVIPNLDLIDYDELDMVKKINDMYKKSET